MRSFFKRAQSTPSTTPFPAPWRVAGGHLGRPFSRQETEDVFAPIGPCVTTGLSRTVAEAPASAHHLLSLLPHEKEPCIVERPPTAPLKPYFQASLRERVSSERESEATGRRPGGSCEGADLMRRVPPSPATPACGADAMTRQTPAPRTMEQTQLSPWW